MSFVPLPTRRGVLVGLATLPVLSLSVAHNSTEERAKALARALREMELPFVPARLDLLRYDEDELEGDLIIQAVVKLTWAPGHRTRKLTVLNNHDETALEAVLREIFEAFAGS